MTSRDWAFAVTVIAYLLAKDKTPDEIEYLAVLFSQLASTLATLASTPPCQPGGGTSAIQPGQPPLGFVP